MALTPAENRQRQREEQELRARMSLGVKILTTAGFAMIGGTFFKDVVDHHEIAALSFVWAAAGLGSIGFALFFAPMGGSRSANE